jgi:hypothetical protein
MCTWYGQRQRDRLFANLAECSLCSTGILQAIKTVCEESKGDIDSRKAFEVLQLHAVTLSTSAGELYRIMTFQTQNPYVQTNLVALLQSVQLLVL